MSSLGLLTGGIPRSSVSFVSLPMCGLEFFHAKDPSDDFKGVLRMPLPDRGHPSRTECPERHGSVLTTYSLHAECRFFNRLEVSTIDYAE